MKMMIHCDVCDAVIGRFIDRGKNKSSLIYSVPIIVDLENGKSSGETTIVRCHSCKPVFAEKKADQL